jgi:hypothetical protein
MANVARRKSDAILNCTTVIAGSLLLSIAFRLDARWRQAIPTVEGSDTLRKKS